MSLKIFFILGFFSSIDLTRLNNIIKCYIILKINLEQVIKTKKYHMKFLFFIIFQIFLYQLKYIAIFTILKIK